MAESTRTKLDIANQILLNVNERPVKSLTGALGIRLNTSIRSAVNELNTLNDWSWLRQESSALSWTNEYAQLPTFQRIVDVKWLPDDGFNRRIPLEFITQDTFDNMRKVGYDHNQPARPRYYTIGADKQVGVAPFPTVQTEKDKILFYYIGWTGIPEADSENFAIPEDYMEMVLMRASALFALTHLGDSGLAGTFSQAFEALAQRLRDRDRNIPSGGVNMFRPRRV